jgi:hypothetical protein
MLNHLQALGMRHPRMVVFFAGNLLVGHFYWKIFLLLVGGSLTRTVYYYFLVDDQIGEV